MADWQEAVQASVIALLFAFMVAKLVSLVISFRGENLRVERAVPEEEGLNDPDGQGEGLEDVGSDSSEDEVVDEVEEAKENKGFVEGEGVFPGGNSNLRVEERDGFEVRQLNSAGLHSLVEERREEREELDASPGEKEDEVLSVQPPVESLDERRLEPSGDKNKDEVEKVMKKNIDSSVELSDSDEWEGVESSELEENFGAAATFLATQAIGPGLKISNETQLLLYGLYKLATEGPCSTPQPSAYKMSARAKWNAWQKLGNIGPEEAMHRYISMISEISPTWNKGEKKGEDQAQSSTGDDTTQRGGMGPVFSSLVMNEEGAAEEGTLEPVHVCAREGDKAGLLHQLEIGIPVDLTDSDGRTALHWAADRGHLHAVELLLAKGAQIHAKDSEGQTALHYATTCEQEEIAKYLLNRGADLAMKDRDGVTPFDVRPAHWLWMEPPRKSL